jgi:probable rRNA maturation factor
MLERHVVIGGRRRPLPDALTRRIVLGVLERERRAATVSVTWLGRDAMRTLNRDYKGHDRLTDVIAFPLDAPGGRVLGDVYVCGWVAAREAERRGIREREELIRLLVHGTLHVLGWEHPEDESRERSPMWRRQERLVEALA